MYATRTNMTLAAAEKVDALIGTTGERRDSTARPWFITDSSWFVPQGQPVRPWLRTDYELVERFDLRRMSFTVNCSADSAHSRRVSRRRWLMHVDHILWGLA